MRIHPRLITKLNTHKLQGGRVKVCVALDNKKFRSQCIIYEYIQYFFTSDTLDILFHHLFFYNKFNHKIVAMSNLGWLFCMFIVKTKVNDHTSLNIPVGCILFDVL